MKVLNQNVYIGKICVCTEHTTKASGSFGEGMVGSCEIKFDVLNQKEILIKVGKNDYRQARDLYNASKNKPILPKIFITNSAMQSFPTQPSKAGELFVQDLEKVYPYSNEEDEIDLADVLIEYYQNKSEENSKSL